MAKIATLALVVLFVFSSLVFVMPYTMSLVDEDHYGSPARIGGGIVHSTSYLDGGDMDVCDGIPNGFNATAHSNDGAKVIDHNGTRSGCGHHHFNRNLPYHYTCDRACSATSRH